jgi:hypothetical protein
MRNKYKIVLGAITIITMLICYGGSCSKKKSDKDTITSSSGTTYGTLSGTVLNYEGQPIEGAVVVVGESSPNATTDANGQFTINDVPTGAQSINIISGGFYTLNRALAAVLASTDLGNVKIKEFAEDLEDLPKISISNVSITGNTLTVTAIITPGVNADAVNDVRAELLHYNTGSVMSLTGTGVYTGTAVITIPSNAVGPYLSVVVFAIDEKRKVGSSIETIAYSAGSGTGIFTADTISGTWAGTIRYPRNNIDNDNRKRAVQIESNTNLSISGTNATGSYAEPRMYRLIQGLSPIETGSFNGGTVTLIDASIGIYKIDFNFPGISRTLNATLLARCDSATSPTNLSGIIKLREFDTTTAMTVTNYVGRFHLQKNITWATSDFNSPWILSDKFGVFGKGTPFDQYVPPFQLNESLVISASGNVTTGTTTMGPTISSGSFTISDTSLGAFSVVITTSNGISTTFYGLMNLKKNHINGIKKITGAGTQYGFFWGPKAPTPHYNIADFASRKFNGVIKNSVFLGFMNVVTGPEAGLVYMVGLNFDGVGNIVNGGVGYITGTNISVFTSGGIGSFDTTTGQFGAIATGTGPTLIISPTDSRNASMGVCKARLVGDFTLGANSGYFFMHRFSESQQ